jgi:hypothetical protein
MYVNNWKNVDFLLWNSTALTMSSVFQVEFFEQQLEGRRGLWV